MKETKDILKKVKKIEIKTRKLVDGLLQGSYHSIFKGRGIEFSESREYVPGDDIRAIDWKMTSRLNHPYVKEFIEERELTAYILFDASESNEFGNIKSKKETSIELAASIMFAAIKNNDKIGLCIFTHKVEKFIPARKGKKHALKMIRELLQFTPKFRTTDISEAIRYSSKVVKRKSIIFLISDFYSQDFRKALKIIKHKHDVIGINMKEAREDDMPDVGYINLEDEETGEQILIDTSDGEFRKNYVAHVKRRNDSLDRNFKRLKIDLVSVKSDEPFERPVRRFFRLREKRMIR